MKYVNKGNSGLFSRRTKSDLRAVLLILRPIDLIHDCRHVCFHIIMQIRHMISAGEMNNKLANFNFFQLSIIKTSLKCSKQWPVKRVYCKILSCRVSVNMFSKLTSVFISL